MRSRDDIHQQHEVPSLHVNTLLSIHQEECFHFILIILFSTIGQKTVKPFFENCPKLKLNSVFLLQNILDTRDASKFVQDAQK